MPTSLGRREPHARGRRLDGPNRTGSARGEQEVSRPGRTAHNVSASTVITDVAGAATAVGVLFGAAQLLLGRSEARTTFEDAVSVQCRQMIKPRLSDALLAGLTPSERDLVDPYHEYLDLCNEQVCLRMQGRVRRRTWREWRQGIEANLDRGSIKDAWLAVCGKLDDFDELRLLHVLAMSATHGPGIRCCGERCIANSQQATKRSSTVL
jgi:hypothetical protein